MYTQTTNINNHLELEVLGIMWLCFRLVDLPESAIPIKTIYIDIEENIIILLMVEHNTPAELTHIMIVVL